jgi:hypothetical protein
VPTIFLRELLERGFCGHYSPAAKPPTTGHLHWALDKIIQFAAVAGTTKDPIQLSNQYGVRFGDQQFFMSRIEGIMKKLGYFHTTDVEILSRTIHISHVDEIEFLQFRDKSTGSFIEPVYHFYNPDYHVPMYSLMVAYLMDMNGPLTVDCVSMIGESVSTKTWDINRTQCKELLDGRLSGKLVPGRQCAECSSVCLMKTDFESLVYSWKKAQQEAEVAEQKIRDHLTYKGPTKCGAHLVYMKESRRRTLTDKASSELVHKLLSHGSSKYLKPDAAEIAKDVASGKLDSEYLKPFKESSSFSIDTTFSL